jgi:very-short-patch-repair endonuclease
VAKTAESNRGRRHSDAARIRMSVAGQQAWANGRHSVNRSFRYTKLAQALHRHLSSCGLTLEPEVRFGRFTVDLYDRTNHVGYEADGRYWHERHEASSPGFHARRDTYLSDRFGLRVVHFDELEIKRMTKERAA